jgi:hypothetical protein
MKSFTSFMLFAVFLFCSLSLNAVDFGLVFYQNAEVNVPAFDFEEKSVDISGVLFPWFSAHLSGEAYLYISAAINYETDPMLIIPELTKSDISFNLENTNINVGRIFYSDPLGFTAYGLFDGVQFLFITRGGNIRAGWLYTGFLYKERAAITMTPNEMQSANTKVDYSDFVNTYFAPARILMTLEYDHPAIGGFIGLKTSIIGQFDSGSNKLNSQYFTGDISFLGKSVILDMGGCFELIEYNDKTTPAYATSIGLTFILPTKLENQIKLFGRYSSGVSEDESIGAFLPLTTVPQGELVEAKLSALSLLSLDYTGRMAKSLSANTAFTYFIRTDLGTYAYYPVTAKDKEGFFLGAEIFGRIIWNISSGIRLNFGTGVFLPALGDAAPDADMLWRTKLNLVFSIY